jgi:phospholipase/carboxylesterase
VSKNAYIWLSLALLFGMSPSLHAADPYPMVIAGQEERLLRFLRTFETFQEELHLAKIDPQRKKLFDSIGNLLPELIAELGGVSVPGDLTAFDTEWKKALGHFENAYMLILTSSTQEFLGAFLQSRREFTQGSYLLYEQRHHLPQLREYWVLPGALSQQSTLETAMTNDPIPIGITHHRQAATHASYSIYVPENYDPNQTWPLVIALHGSHGSGGEYLLTWLRLAKSRGYIVLAPNSRGPTWSIDQPVDDIRSILAMLTAVAETYNVDTRRIFVSGLSDGGTFSYALGLHCPQLFAGIAPIAAVLPDWYPLEPATALPILLIHGAKDYIFPVTLARAAHSRFQDNQFDQVTYIELPDWGHAFTYSINEAHVQPWFAGLAKQSPIESKSNHADPFSCSALE